MREITLLTQPSSPTVPSLWTGRGQKNGTVEDRGWALARLAFKGAAKQTSIRRQHKGEMGTLQHKEQVWSQPTPTHGKPKRGSVKRPKQRLSLSFVETWAWGTRGSWTLALAARHPPLQWCPTGSFQFHSSGWPLYGPASLNTSHPRRVLHRASKMHLMLTPCRENISVN